jgi:hypothetical protein
MTSQVGRSAASHLLTTNPQNQMPACLADGERNGRAAYSASRWIVTAEI